MDTFEFKITEVTVKEFQFVDVAILVNGEKRGTILLTPELWQCFATYLVHGSSLQVNNSVLYVHDLKAINYAYKKGAARGKRSRKSILHSSKPVSVGETQIR